MKNLIIFLALLIITFSTIKGQEYQYEGQINGREATLLLHFVTATDDTKEEWSHGSFYYNDEQIANVIFQYKPLQPESGELHFNMIPTNVNQVDYIVGDVTKSNFEGHYKVEGTSHNIDFATQINQPLIIFNYYKTTDNKEGNKFKYFGKFIVQNDENVMYQLTSYLNGKKGRVMPRTYLENIYAPEESQFQNSASDWLHNLAIFPIIVTKDKVVYKMTDYVKQGNTELKDQVSYINYDVANHKIIDASNFFKPGSEAQIQKIVNTESKLLGDASSQALQGMELPYTEVFYLANNGVVFFYPNISVDGGQLENYQVFVSYDKLSGVMQ